MSAVEVEVVEEGAGKQDAGAAGPGPEPKAEGPRAGGAGASRRQPKDGREAAVEVEIEREITKRQLYQSISTIVVVILYMVFTLLRDRDSGVVVVDPNEGDDWDEGA